MYNNAVMFEQNLPTYIKDFESAPWLKTESEHYVFHYLENSLAEKEIEFISKTQEEAFNKIISTLNIDKPERKIKYYLYPDGGTKKKLMGSDWFAQSIYNDFAVHAIYNEKDKVIGPHEDTHLLTLPWGLSIGFFQEGLAEFMVGHDWYGGSHDKRAADALSKKILHSLERMFSHQAWVNTPDENAIDYYAYAGSFTAWLINTFGLDIFKFLYTKLNRDNTEEGNIQIFIDTYKIKPKEAELIWKTSIDVS